LLRRLLAAVATLLAAPGARAGGHAGFGCSPGFDIGAVTLQEYVNLPRNQAGLAAGKYTLYDLEHSKFDPTDLNPDGVICVKDVATLNGDADGWRYYYDIVDDNASAPTG
jgi:hypothetical protein